MVKSIGIVGKLPGVLHRKAMSIALLLSLLAHAQIACAGPLTASGSTSVGQTGGGYVTTDYLFQVYMEDRQSGQYVPDTLILQTAINGSTSDGLIFLLTPEIPNFSNFVSALTDGSNSMVLIQVLAGFSPYGTGGLIGSGNTILKSDFHDPSGQPVSIQGATVSSLSLHIDQFDSESPGQNPNKNGLWTDLTAGYTLTISPVPEPSMLILSAIGLIGLIICKARKTIRQTIVG